MGSIPGVGHRAIEVIIMALDRTQEDTGLHHFEIVTDKQGHNPQIACWCTKRFRLDFTWGVRRFVMGLNRFLVEHESCKPLEEQEAVRSA